MANENLLDKLYRKVTAEYVKFISDLHQADTETAIESAFEIVWKGNISTYLEREEIDLTDEQCEALLSSKNTLDEIYYQFLNEDGMNSYKDLGYTLKDTADRIQISLDRSAHLTAPLILHDFQTARFWGEDGINDFRTSRKENKACAEALIAAAKENRTYGDMPGTTYFNAAKTVEDVLKKGFSLKRLGYVIASQVVRNQDCLDNPLIIDGRFSRNVKEWAINIFSQQENFPFKNFENCDITSAIHHTLVDSLAKAFIDKQLELSNRQVLYVIEQGDSVFHYKASSEFTLDDILKIANAEEPFFNLMKIGEHIPAGEYAEIQQSESFSASAEFNFDTGKAEIYEVNGGKGGIAEENRTDDNVSFSRIKISSYVPSLDQSGSEQGSDDNEDEDFEM